MKFISLKKISTSESWRVRWLLTGFIAFGIVTIKFYPLDLLQRYFPSLFRSDSSCILLNVTGFPCPFCGMSRAFYEFTHFNFLMSMYYNPSSVIFFSFLGIACLSIFVLSLFNYKISVDFNRRSLFIAVFLLITIWSLNILYGHH